MRHWGRALEEDLKLPPRITHVAVRFLGEVYALPAPNRHHHVLWMIAEKLGLIQVNAYGDNQGFLDASGQYLTRKQALEAALANGQVKDLGDVRAGRLFSEDLW